MQTISVRGAREHNLKNLDVDLPRDRLVVITGVSGSGKSSLAFDTIYAEGQRRYVESLSAYARQFLGQMEKPDVDHIDGLSPAISIEQRTAGRNPRSTVATATEIADYLRLLFARVGVQHCVGCGEPITRQTVQEMVDSVLEKAAGRRTQILAPLVRGRKGEYRAELAEMKREGFLRARIDGKWVDLDDPPTLDKKRKHTIEIVVDRLKPSPDARQRLTDSMETALGQSGGLVTIVAEKLADRTLNEHASCTACGISCADLEPRGFSFNSPYGACPDCDGLGTRTAIDPERIVPDPSLSLGEGAIASYRSATDSSWLGAQLKALARAYKFSLKTPWKKLPARTRKVILHGAGGKELNVVYQDARFKVNYKKEWEGVLPNLMRRYRETASDGVREYIRGFMGETPCPGCHGARLRPESLAVRIHGMNIHEVVTRSVKGALAWVDDLELGAREAQIGAPILKEVRQRLGFMMDVGLEYLTLDRAASTLSGGEAQRIRLATQIGSRLMGVLYVLDEPSIGLHSRDNERLLRTLLSLRDLGNTVLVVEHDLDTMRSADHIVDLGPGAGRQGGELVAEGAPAAIARHRTSLTGRYLSGRDAIPLPESRREGHGTSLWVRGAAENNLQEVDVRFPLGVFTCVTGVSGSGKSTLINDILFKALARHFHGSADAGGRHRRLEGLEYLDKVVNIDQSPIGRTPRSNPATYTGVFTEIRGLFADLPESKVRGYQPGRFSFNVKGGRCEACTGDGVVKIEMHFLPDVYVKCDVCQGKRYNRETLDVTFKGKTISDVLEMTVAEAVDLLGTIPKIRRRLEVLDGVGLGYIHLGQPATTLSGGEAQRIKLSAELSKVATGRTLYILDEPTTGLHVHDVRRLLEVLAKLVDRGNTVVVIEHNLDVIKTADHIIDLGPEGGDGGGRVVVAGPPEAVAAEPLSHTGVALAGILSGGGRRSSPRSRKAPTKASARKEATWKSA
jgi:excinuclease ABC subunit A